jgi:LysR family transcriptional regulator, glycine cleavage system transcriptional activator
MSDTRDPDPRERLPPFPGLRAFDAAARHGSFARAADELGVTAAAISQHIQALETFAGQPLFRRMGRGIELTDAGQAARPLVVDAMTMLAEAARIMRLPLRSKRISISAVPSFAAKWLLPRIEKFRDSHPDVEVWIAADMALVDFATADVDLAIRYGAGSYQGAHAQPLMAESVTVVCSPNLLNGAALKNPADLTNFALLHDESPDQDPACPTWRMWLAARGVDSVDSQKGLRLNQSSLVVEAAAAGRGVALAKTQLAAADLAAGRLVAPFAAEVTPLGYAYWLVWPRGRTVSQSVRAFIDWLHAEAHDGRADYGAGI